MITKIIATINNNFQSLKGKGFQWVLSILFLFGFTSSAQAQCGPYQYYEGIPVSGALTGWTVGSGGTWSLPNTSGAAPRSGKACLLQNVAPATANTTYIISPKINTPKTFSFWIKTSVAGALYSIALSDDNKVTWVTIPNGTNSISTTLNPTPYTVTATIPATTTAWQLVTLTASFPASANGYFFKISDNRASGTTSLWIDDISWTSSIDTDNTIVVPAVNPVAATPSLCNITVPNGAAYRFYDVGGKSDFYSYGQTNTVTFTPVNAGDKIKVTFMTLPGLVDTDKILIFDNTTAVGAQILGSPVIAGFSPPAAYTSSISADGSITIKFTSNGAYASGAIVSMSDGFDIKVECTGSICPLPFNIGAVTNVTDTTAKFDWDGISAGYEYTITNSTTQPAAAGLYSYTIATDATLTGLTPNTYYYGWVRSKCGATFYSNWVAVGWFQTQCTPTPLPYVENFDGLDYSLPGCTTSDPDGDWQTFITDGNLFSTISGYFFYTKPVTLVASGVYNVSYDYSALNGTADFDVYIGSTNDPSILIPANKLTSHVGASALTHNSFNFTTSAAGTYFLALYLNATSVPLTTKLIIDNFVLDCANPVITASSTLVCSTNDIVTLSGTGAAGYTWSASAGTLYTNAAATVAYVPLANVQTVYLRTNVNATITLTGVNGTCNKTATANIVVKSTKWNGSGWDNGAPDSSTQAIFNGNYNSNNLITPGDINACSVIVQSGTVLFKSGHSLISQNSVTVSGGTLTFENNASLVQPNNVTNNVGVYNGGNVGAITYLRTTKPMVRNDYTYWSSPVGGQTLAALSVSDRYFYFDAAVSNYWASIANTAIMTPGMGYIVTAPQTFDLVSPQTYAASFSGVPNNGTITAPIVSGKFNLIGNPYPSALDIDKFLVSGLNNTVVDATVYLWTHNTPFAGGQYSPNDYAVYNYLGGTGTNPAPSGSTGGLNNNTPNGKIASGQSFFIKGLATANATFLNTMRVSGSNNQFFKTNATTTLIKKNSRIWLDISNSQGAYKQTLVGYSQQATLGIDRGYDSEFYSFGSGVSLYSLSGTATLAIQGRPLPFNRQDEVPLGYNAGVSGTLTINLSNFDGLFVNQDIYLKDILLNTITDLKNSAYTFQSNAGTFNDRFVLVYSRKKEREDKLLENDFNASSIVLYKPDTDLRVDAGTTIMKEIKIYDIRGSLLLEKNNINATTTAVTIEGTKQVLIIEITTKDGIVVSKKYIN